MSPASRLRIPGRPGRPLDTVVDGRIMQAAREVVGEVGVERTTWARIAARSGSGYPTILRRWSSVEELVIDALRDLDGDVPADADAPVREALEHALRADLEAIATGANRMFVRTLLFASAANAHLSDELQRVLLAPRRERYRRLLELGVERDELRPGADVEAAIGVLRGVLVRAIVDHRAADPDRAGPTVDLLIDGMAAGR
ncbi:TetR/AcrR family transcriptional regulator [Miltoncostaea marina]|uniref:TetR/AcrR family transcriptional regulator n=1 Tax=Miltoncostaea marina TaxID=2843215 RepID=UPI001C3CF13B|nr:TetR/AcrR family transcriptional regulator [Miltoncostaea marina]